MRAVLTCRFLWLGVAGFVLGACSSNEEGIKSLERWGHGRPVRAQAGPKKPASVLDALRSDHAEITRALGDHQFAATIRLRRAVPGLPTLDLHEELHLSTDAHGRFRAERNTDPPYGIEIIWTGDWLYPRQRYGEFVRRRPESPEEPAHLAQNIYGALSTYVDFIAPFLEVARMGEGSVSGRQATKYQLTLKPGDAHVAVDPAGASSVWRKRVTVQSLTGTIWLDETSQAPLKARLSASWTFVPPEKGNNASTGIPTAFAESQRGTMSIELVHELTPVNQIAAIEPPPANQIATHYKRLRLETERQMVLGERPLPAKGDWTN